MHEGDEPWPRVHTQTSGCDLWVGMIRNDSLASSYRPTLHRGVQCFTAPEQADLLRCHQKHMLGITSAFSHGWNEGRMVERTAQRNNEWTTVLLRTGAWKEGQVKGRMERRRGSEVGRKVGWLEGRSRRTYGRRRTEGRKDGWKDWGIKEWLAEGISLDSEWQTETC